MELATATWTDVADRETSLAVLPVGSTEQHGPHAPLGTDAVASEEIARGGVEAHGGAVLAPTIPLGIAEEHRAFPGTMWLSPETFRTVVREAVGSLAAHGFDRLVVVNGHGGNVDALREITATISRHDDAYAVAFTWFENVGDRGGEMGHGGPLETSLLLHRRPELIRRDRLAEARDGGADRWGEWVGASNLAHDSAEFTENGVVGDPTAASAELGAELYERATTALAELLAAVETRELDG